MRMHVILLLTACGSLACGLAPARAQLNQISFPRRVPQKSPTLTLPKMKAGDDYHRLLEILIELSWLGDPITFPHMLEAKVEAGTVRVRGKIPDAAVREHALKLARLPCPMTVIDETKPGPAIERSTRLNPLVLQHAVQSALREALPRTDNALRIHCEMDGRVIIEGHVKSFAEKLAVSKKLQRLHGCACVVNRLQVGASAPAVARSSPAAVRTDAAPLVCIRRRPQSRFRTLLCLPGKHTRTPAPRPPGPLPAALAEAAPLLPHSDAILRVSYNPIQPILEYSDAPARAETGDCPYESRGVLILPDSE